MPFSFLAEDTDFETYRIDIDDEGEISLWTTEGDEPDWEMIEAHAVFAQVDLFISKHFATIWASIMDALASKKVAAKDDFLEAIRTHNTEQKEWISSKRWEYHDGQYHDLGYYEEYIEKLPLEEFVGYIGKAIGHLLREAPYAEPGALDVALFIAAIRRPDGSELEFDLDDEGHEDEGYIVLENLPKRRSEEGPNRKVFVESEPMFDYPVIFKREIYNPITFESEIDPARSPDYWSIGEEDLHAVLDVFGLMEKNQQLSAEAEKHVDAPWHPAPDEEGLWGVYYAYVVREESPGTGYEVTRVQEEIVSYGTEDQATQALELSEEVIRNGEDARGEAFRDRFFDPYIVRRSSTTSDEWEKLEGQE